MANFNEIFTNITNVNIAAGAGIVFSKLDSATVAGVSAVQTLTNKTLTSPIITGQISAEAGAVGAPSYTFVGDLDTGIFSAGANQVAFTAGGISALNISAGVVQIGNARSLLIQPGSLGTLGVYFDSDSDTGFYLAGANDFRFVSNGSDAFRLTATAVEISPNRQFTAQDGLSASPGISFVADPDTGIFRSAANVMALCVGGTEALIINGGGANTSAYPFFIQNGAAATPSLAFSSNSNTGLYRLAANTVGVAANGVRRFSVSATENQSEQVIKIANLGTGNNPAQLGGYGSVYGESVAFAWGSFDGATGAPRAGTESLNIDAANCVRNAAGDYTVDFINSLVSQTRYIAIATYAEDGSGQYDRSISTDKANTSVDVFVYDDGAGLDDGNFDLVCFGVDL